MSTNSILPSATNAVGLSFIEWTKGDLWWHAETRMEPLEALDWCGTPCSLDDPARSTERDAQGSPLGG